MPQRLRPFIELV